MARIRASGAWGARLLLLALLLLPMLGFFALAVHDRASGQLLFAAPPAADVAAIELARGSEQLVLQRRRDGWVVLSAADAPGDAAHIERFLADLAALSGRPPASDAPAPRGEPVGVRLSDRDGTRLATLDFWSGLARLRGSNTDSSDRDSSDTDTSGAGNNRAGASRAGDGPLLALRAMPDLPLWASAWSTLEAPRILPADLSRADRLTAAGPLPLDAAATAQVLAVLSNLSAVRFVPVYSVDWSNATMLRLVLTDGRQLDLAQTGDGDGRYFVRFGGLADPVAQRFAFRGSEALP